LIIRDRSRDMNESLRRIGIASECGPHCIVVACKRCVDDGLADICLAERQLLDMVFHFGPAGETGFAGDDELRFT